MNKRELTNYRENNKNKNNMKEWKKEKEENLKKILKEGMRKKGPERQVNFKRNLNN